MIFRVLIHVLPSTSILFCRLLSEIGTAYPALIEMWRIDSFKRHLNQHRATVPKYFYTLAIEIHKFCIPDSDWDALLLIMTFS